MAEKAASALMQVPLTARYAHFDMLCAVDELAERIEPWDETHGKAIYRLMCYIPPCHGGKSGVLAVR